MSYVLAGLGAAVDDTATKTLQTTLKKYGFYTGPIDGIPGPATFAAQVAFARAAVKQVDRMASKIRVWEVLNTGAKKMLTAGLDSFLGIEGFQGSIGEALQKFARERAPAIINTVEQTKDAQKLGVLQRSTDALVKFAQAELGSGVTGGVGELLSDFVKVGVWQSFVDLGKATKKVADLASDTVSTFNKTAQTIVDPSSNPLGAVVIFGGLGALGYAYYRVFIARRKNPGRGRYRRRRTA